MMASVPAVLLLHLLRCLVRHLAVNKQRHCCHACLLQHVIVDHCPYNLSVLQKDPVRIVAVSSMVHRYGGLDLQDLHFRNRAYGSLKAYAQSKLCNILFIKELASRYTLDVSCPAAICIMKSSVLYRFYQYYPKELIRNTKESCHVFVVRLLSV